MKCKDCDLSMQAITCWDDPNTGIAFNVFLCNRCGMLAKEMVWYVAGVTWIPAADRGRLRDVKLLVGGVEVTGFDEGDEIIHLSRRSESDPPVRIRPPVGTPCLDGCRVVRPETATAAAYFDHAEGCPNKGC